MECMDERSKSDCKLLSMISSNDSDTLQLKENVPYNMND